VVVRHGETTWGAQARFAGRKDVSLTPRGRRQAAAVAGRIRLMAPAVVLTSPLQRCRNTAQAIAAEVGAPVVVDERLIDGVLGDWTGLRAAEIEERWPQTFASWRSDPDAAPPGGESFSEIRQRVRPLMTDALSTYRGHTVVLVTHAAPSKMILTTALNVDPAVAYRIRVDTASLSGFTVEADGAVMVWAINETGHLMG
jgi:probable phosphoglycerate mutase